MNPLNLRKGCLFFVTFFKPHPWPLGHLAPLSGTNPTTRRRGKGPTPFSLSKRLQWSCEHTVAWPAQFRWLFSTHPSSPLKWAHPRSLLKLQCKQKWNKNRDSFSLTWNMLKMFQGRTQKISSEPSSIYWFSKAGNINSDEMWYYHWTNQKINQQTMLATLVALKSHIHITQQETSRPCIFFPRDLKMPFFWRFRVPPLYYILYLDFPRV